MFQFLQRLTRRRIFYLHEDDHCQQQLLPRDATAYVNVELKRVAEFAEAHRAPDGVGWTDIYLRPEAPIELDKLAIEREQFQKFASPILPSFNAVCTAGSYRERWRNTAAWGTSQRCALLADWNDADIISNAWTAFFDLEETSILAASRAVAALAELYPLVYVDWAWGYICDASDADTFASLLRAKLQQIAERTRSFEIR